MREAEAGYASLAALVVLSLLGIMGASLASSTNFSGRRLVRFEAEARMRSRLLDGLDEVAESLAADNTPVSDSPGDPVWKVVRSGTRSGDAVELTDISSKININTIANSYLLSDALRVRYASFTAPEAIRDYLAESGPFGSFKEAEGIIPEEEEDEGRFFTVYGYWNPFISDVNSLAAMIRARGAEDDAEALAARLLGAARADSGFSDRDIGPLLGEDGADLAALLTTGPLINVHFADAELLAAVLDFNYAGEKLPNRTGALDALMAGRLMGELSPGDLGAAVEREEGQDDVLRFLGTVTWFWEIAVQGGGMRLTAVAARLPGLGEGGGGAVSGDFPAVFPGGRMRAVMLLTFGCWVSLEDGRSMVIPDRAVGGGLGLLLLGTLTGALVPAEALLGFLLALLQMGLVYVIFRGRGMGLGDVKYACLLGGLLGPLQWVGALFWACSAALVFTVAARVFKGEPLRARIPFAPYLTAGGLAALLGGPGGLFFGLFM